MPDSILDAVEGLLGAFAGFDAAVFSGVECAVIAERVALAEKACAGVRLLAADRAVQCKVHEQSGYADGSEWLARQAGITAGEAKRKLRAVGRMGERTRDALLEGKLSLDQAEEIVATAEELPGSEGELVEIASGSDLGRLRQEARDMRFEAMDRNELHERQVAAREFRHWRDRLGMVRFSGALPPEIGVSLVNRLELRAHKLRNKAKKDPVREVESWDAYAADALVEMLSGTAIKGSGQTVLNIVCDLAAWLRGHDLPGEVCHIIGGGPIPVAVAKQLAKDPFLKGVLHDGTEILVVKHYGRYIPAELRSALDLGKPPKFQGRECVRCGKTFGLQDDHRDPLGNGGATEKANLQDLCYACHQAKTEQDRKAGRLGPKPRPTETGRSLPKVAPGGAATGPDPPSSP